jgi:hypothetical protein
VRAQPVRLGACGFRRKAHPDIAESAIDVKDFASDSGGEIGAKKCGSVADVLGCDIPAQWRYLSDVTQHLAETGNARGCQRLDRRRKALARRWRSTGC